MISVVTFLWGDGKYNVSHVETLASMVRRHYSAPHKFICVTNQRIDHLPLGIFTVTTRSTQPGRTLHLALDLGNRTRKLAFTTSITHAPRLWTITARDLPNLTRRSWPQERASASRRTPRC